MEGCGVTGQVITHSPFQGIIFFIGEDVGLGKQEQEVILRAGAGAAPGHPPLFPTGGHAHHGHPTPSCAAPLPNSS